MEYQKIINLLENKANQPSKSRAKSWVKINDALHRAYGTVNQVRFKASMLRSILCHYSDAYIPVIDRITITRTEDTYANKRTEDRDKEVIFTNCASFTKCISEINNTQVDDAQQIDIVILIYNLI